MEGYSWYGNNRKSISKRAIRGSGGVGVLIKHSVLEHYNVAAIAEKYEGILWLQLIQRQNGKQVGICVCYLPPIGSSRGDKSQEFFDTLKALVIDNYHLGDFLICGDLNARCGSLDDAPGVDNIPTRISVDNISNKIGKELIEMLRTLELGILNGRFEPTKDNFTSVSTKGLSVVDYCIAPLTSLGLFSNFQVHDIPGTIISKGIPIDSTIPDHRILTVDVKQSLTTVRKINGRKPRARRKVPPEYMQDAATAGKVQSLAAQLLFDTSHVDVNTVYDSFCKVIDEQIGDQSPTNLSHTSNRRKAWWNEELRELAKAVRFSLKAWEQNKSNNDLRELYLHSQKEFSKLVRKSKRRYRRERQNRLLDQQKRNPKAFWNFVKGIGSTTHELPSTMRTADGQTVTEGSEVLSMWRDYFCSLLNPHTSGHSLTAALPSESLNLDASELNATFSYEEVKSAILANDNAKSPGFDQIQPLFIKNDVCIDFLHSLFNYCYQHGEVPSAWFKTVIKPIPKSHLDPQSTTNYRGIALQSFVAKSYCRMLNSRLRDWLESNDALSDEQNGFRANRSCQDHIFALTSVIENRMCQKKDTFACFVDFKKAFDCVNRDLLWDKLSVRFGLFGNFLTALQALYADVRCVVDVNQAFTDWFTVNNGVKQGCILSPTLFAMFIDDLVSEINSKQAGVECQTCSISALLYADDVVLLAPSAGNLQCLIDVVAGWCAKWEMNINTTKTNIVHFRRRLRSKPRSSVTFTFQDYEILYTSQYKYLGLLLHEHLDWNVSVEGIIHKANRALALLNHRMRATGGFHFETYTLLFTQLVQPIIMTNACIWGHKVLPKIMSIQHRALRCFLGVNKTCPLAGLFGETGWIPFKAYIDFSILRFWYRVKSMEGNRLTHKIYVWSKSLAESGRKNWARSTTNLLDSLRDHNQLPHSCTEKDVWIAIMDREFQKWEASVQTTPSNSESGGRLRFYRHVKDEPSQELYVNRSISAGKRRIITMFRCGCLPLDVELGRYRSPKIPLQQRTCQLCKEGLGDEVHFVNFCHPLMELRAKLYQVASDALGGPSFYTLPPVEKTILIMSLCAHDTAVSKLIYEMYLLQRSLTEC